MAPPPLPSTLTTPPAPMTINCVVGVPITPLVITLNNPLFACVPFSTGTTIQSPYTTLPPGLTFSPLLIGENVIPGTGPLTISGTPNMIGTWSIQFSFGGFQSPNPPCQASADIVTDLFTFIVTAPILKNKKSGFSPDTICCNFPDNNCPPKVIYKGYYYERIKDSNCYIKLKR